MKNFWQRERVNIDFEKERQEKLNEIGIYLQEIRKKSQLSLDVISNQTHIPMRLLKAIEEAKIEELPEPVYTRELLRKYANYLGLNGDNYAERFNVKADQKKNIVKKSKFTWNVYRIEIKPIYLYITYIALMLISVKSLGDFLQKYPLAIKNVPEIKIKKIQNYPNLSTKTEPSYIWIPVVEKNE